MIATYKFKMFGRARKKSFKQKNRHKLLPINMSHIRSKNPMGTALNCLGYSFMTTMIKVYASQDHKKQYRSYTRK